MILAIDPGNELSAWVLFDVKSGRPTEWAKEPNEKVRDRIALSPAQGMAIEMIASYGMAVGEEVFQTCVWTGRFIERWLVGGIKPGRFDPVCLFRREVKLHLCGSARAKDTNVRQALIDLYGPGREKAIGKKASPGPLYGMKADCWAALGVAVTAAEGGK